jgi:hypothetical protein
MYSKTRCFLPAVVFLSLATSALRSAAWDLRPGPRRFDSLDLGAKAWEFEPNRGQVDSSVRFRIVRPGYVAYVTQSGLSFAYPGRDGASTSSVALGPQIISLDLVGIRTAAECEGRQEQPARTHYLIGDDPSRWVRDVPSFGHVYCREVYAGVDMKVHGNDRGLQYDFVVAPGSDPNQIRIKLLGASVIRVNRGGNLVLTLPAGGEVTHQRPVAYQETSGRRKPVPARYERGRDGLITLRLGRYDRTVPLVIDPTITHATFLGGTDGPGSFDFGRDIARAIAIDSQGNAYVTGGTSSRNFPGAYLAPPPPPAPTHTRVFVTKYSPTGQRVYSSYFGGSIGFAGGRPVDNGYGIGVSSRGEACIAGGTTSKDFPTAGHVYQRAATGVGDGEGPHYAFVTKLNPQGSGFVFSTYLHGSEFDHSGPVQGEVTDDWGFGAASDGEGRCYAAGITNTNNFKVTPNAYQPQSNKPADSHRYTAWVAKFAHDGRAEYVTYLGGSTNDSASAIATDAAGRAYVLGDTRSADFPLFLPYDSTLGGGLDAFVTVLNPEGTSLAYSTLLGGSNAEQVVAGDIAITGDALPEVLVTGATKSSDFPLAIGVPDPGDNYDVFVARLAPFAGAAQSLRGARYLAGNGNEGFGQDVSNEAEALKTSIAVDAERAYVVGNTTSTNFPGSNPQRQSFFIALRPAPPLDIIESALLPGTKPKGIAIEMPGVTAVAGVVVAPDVQAFSQFITPNASQPQFGGGPSDAFFLKTCDCSSVPAIPRVEPTPLSLGPWSATVETSDDDGLVLKDVKLGGRNMAQMISLPYLSLQTSNYSNDRVELRPDDTGGGPAASRLVGYRVRPPAPGAEGAYGPFTVEATYQIRNISSSGRSCLRVQQAYEFFGTIDEEESPGEFHCEPSQTQSETKLFVGLRCARLNPVVRYSYCALDGESLTSLKAPQRLHFRIELATQANVLLIRDFDSWVPPFYAVVGANPHASERQYSTIQNGQTVSFSADNYHQSLGTGPVDEPLPPPGCPECVHTHWRWGRFLDFPIGHPPGAPLIPAGSNQSLDFATVRFHSGEEDPANGFESLVNSEPTVGTDNVLWYSPTGRRASDAFFTHGLFYSPDWTRGHHRWGVLFGSIFSAALSEGEEPTGTPPDPGITAFTPIDPASLAPYPACFAPFGSNAVNVTTSGTLGTDPIIVAHGTPDVTDAATFARLRLLHREGPTLVDRTDLAHTSFRDQRVQAEVDSLGAFVLASRHAPAITAPRSVAPLSAGNVASVANNAGSSYNWTIVEGGGSIPGSTTTPSIAFTAGGPGATMVVQSTETGPCTATAQRRVQVDFNDVPGPPAVPHFFHSVITTLAGNKITFGCGDGNYCPADPVLRNQMSVFLLLSREGSTYLPPACQAAQQRFTDVPASNGFCRWIEELARRGITVGCATNQFCPSGSVTRGTMAVWLILARHDGHFVPAPCTTAPFSDVPTSSPLCPWIQELKNRGITTGCGGGAYCPNAVVTRAAMAAFLVGTFGLVFP